MADNGEVSCAYRRDSNLRDSVVRSTLDNTTATNQATNDDRGTFSCGRTRCDTLAYTNSSASITTPGEHITSLSKYTCVSENVVYAIKCRTCNKMYVGETGRRLGDRFREHLRCTRLPDTDLPVGCHFASPGHSVGDVLISMVRSGFRSPTERRSFGNQTPDTSTSRTECGLQLYLNFSKSARACNVSLCFDFYLNVTLRVPFSFALNH